MASLDELCAKYPQSSPGRDAIGSRRASVVLMKPAHVTAQPACPHVSLVSGNGVHRLARSPLPDHPLEIYTGPDRVLDGSRKPRVNLHQQRPADRIPSELDFTYARQTDGLDEAYRRGVDVRRRQHALSHDGRAAQ